MNQFLPLRSIGKSDLMITPIGLGCWQFSKQQNMAGKFWPKMEDDLISRMIKISLEGGINWFDTAEIYGNGASERVLAASLRLTPLIFTRFTSRGVSQTKKPR